MILKPFDNVQAFIERLPVNEQAGHLALSSNCDQSLLCFCILINIFVEDVSSSSGSNIIHYAPAIRAGFHFVEF